MVRSLTGLVGIATFAATLLAAPVPKPQEVVLYYPTTVGDALVYQNSNGTFTGETVVAAERTAAGVVVTLERGLVGAPPTGFRNKLLVNESGVLEVCVGDELLVPPKVLLKSQAKHGDVYELWPGSLAYEVGRPEVVAVPAGTFTAIPLRSEVAGDGGRIRRMVAWWAPRVGVVRSESRIDDNSKFSSELLTFTPGKK